MDNINPNFKKFKSAELPSADWLLGELSKGNRAALSRALTLVESKSQKHRKVAEELIHKALPLSGNSVRIGITGVPGVGKSTFIEAFGTYLTSIGKKVAVLAIDPSSTKNRGSILGDKTRMNELSQNEMAFIRPSPSAGSLGGVARKTRESILLCEAAGYDVIIVETVGVGQSETAVKSMVDFFMLLMLAGAGDELQGIKRGIMEMADLLIINKADGNNARNAKRASGEYKRALHLFPANDNEWIPRVSVASAIEKTGMSDAWEVITEFENQQKNKGYFKTTRQEQALKWFEESIGELLLEKFNRNPEAQENLQQLKEKVRSEKLEPFNAANQAVDFLFKTTS
ncbi:LAO/AO transport system ATPase [Owenweeksia hongkongensis DSM 17368]|uniref:LAO/AO transport system ATPase n=1 Tax=Owenweeksia hongkongensis (strain DSM 17368 / CIP 108786 / JCM 12287 / NRRL B-23963 / UST20020801) TaxID=926562 RepID=G8R8R1_OWEHD|nr:methylmalonyl Co-A mutase-associated GTPase MeaB [Owenweeksia hongkongensis]AEV32491.1 LAO/AO transport system ATPase [Owenweeksia hongkongensis DSM 17368]